MNTLKASSDHRRPNRRIHRRRAAPTWGQLLRSVYEENHAAAAAPLALPDALLRLLEEGA